mgnify:CR=1 FL=1
MMKILIADDMEYARANIMELVKNIFPEAEIDAFSDGTHAWEAAKEREYDLLFTDVRMIRMHGPELAEKSRRKTSPHRNLFCDRRRQSRTGTVRHRSQAMYLQTIHDRGCEKMSEGKQSI